MVKGEEEQGRVSPPKDVHSGSSGALYIVPTPIGNLADISARACEILTTVDIIAAEDTRSTLRLLQLLGLSTRAQLVSYHEHNAAERAGDLVARMERSGVSVALVSDAGTPACSDPGFRLVRAAAQAGLRVVPLPGPSAFLSALVASGLPTDRFLFVGFAPAKSARRRAFLEELVSARATLCFYEAPQRTVALLEDIRAVLGDRAVCVARELTKMYEEFLRGSATSVGETLQNRERLRGEFVVLVEGAKFVPEIGGQAEEGKRLVRVLDAQGLKPNQTKAIVSSYLGVSKKEVYAWMMALRSERS